MIVLDEDTCVVDLAHYFLKFTQEESCGKCPPCRVGTRGMLKLLERIAGGRGSSKDVEELETLAQSIKDASLCALGGTAPNPVSTTLRYFRDEYIEHIEKKQCRSFVCRYLIRYYIDADRCIGCGACRPVCPEGAITGKQKELHFLDQELCVQCGNCFSACPTKLAAIYRTSGELTRVPEPLKKKRGSRESHY